MGVFAWWCFYAGYDVRHFPLPLVDVAKFVSHLRKAGITDIPREEAWPVTLQGEQT